MDKVIQKLTDFSINEPTTSTNPVVSTVGSSGDCSAGVVDSLSSGGSSTNLLPKVVNGEFKNLGADFQTVKFSSGGFLDIYTPEDIKCMTEKSSVVQGRTSPIPSEIQAFENRSAIPFNWNPTFGASDEEEIKSTGTATVGPTSSIERMMGLLGRSSVSSGTDLPHKPLKKVKFSTTTKAMPPPQPSDVLDKFTDLENLISKNFRNTHGIMSIIKHDKKFVELRHFLFAKCKWNDCKLKRIDCFEHIRCLTCGAFDDSNFDETLLCGKATSCKVPRHDKSWMFCDICREARPLEDDMRVCCSEYCTKNAFCTKCRREKSKRREQKSMSWLCDDQCKSPKPCVYFAQGKCNNGRCKYSHDQTFDPKDTTLKKLKDENLKLKEDLKNVQLKCNIAPDAEQLQKDLVRMKDDYKKLMVEHHNYVSESQKKLDAMQKQCESWKNHMDVVSKRVDGILLQQNILKAELDKYKALYESSLVEIKRLNSLVPAPEAKDAGAGLGDDEKVADDSHKAYDNLNFCYEEVLPSKHVPYAFYLFPNYREVTCRYLRPIESVKTDERSINQKSTKLGVKNPRYVVVNFEVRHSVKLFWLFKLCYYKRSVDMTISYEALANYMQSGVTDSVCSDWVAFENLMTNSRLTTPIMFSRNEDLQIVPNTKIIAYHKFKIIKGFVSASAMPDRPLDGRLNGGGKSGSNTGTSYQMSDSIIRFLKGTGLVFLIGLIIRNRQHVSQLDVILKALLTLTRTCIMDVINIIRLLLEWVVLKMSPYKIYLRIKSSTSTLTNGLTTMLNLSQ